jgi:predicted nucleic acid-binding protein
MIRLLDSNVCIAHLRGRVTRAADDSREGIYEEAEALKFPRLSLRPVRPD